MNVIEIQFNDNRGPMLGSSQGMIMRYDDNTRVVTYDYSIDGIQQSQYVRGTVNNVTTKTMNIIKFVCENFRPRENTFFASEIIDLIEYINEQNTESTEIEMKQNEFIELIQTITDQGNTIAQMETHVNTEIYDMYQGLEHYIKLLEDDTIKLNCWNRELQNTITNLEDKINLLKYINTTLEEKNVQLEEIHKEHANTEYYYIKSIWGVYYLIDLKTNIVYTMEEHLAVRIDRSFGMDEIGEWNGYDIDFYVFTNTLK